MIALTHDCTQAYKFRLKTNDEQAAQLRCFAGHCRFVWTKY
ncbi:helix-turn-helix domain-containing protein [Zooshikella ganghwensis]|nr:helix-turn-helix domain-containing protein [Zooshikella ganghwensis]